MTLVTRPCELHLCQDRRLVLVPLSVPARTRVCDPQPPAAKPCRVHLTLEPSDPRFPRRSRSPRRPRPFLGLFLAMAVLLQRGLRAVPLLAWAPRRAAAAWPGDPEPPEPALEETERCGELGPRSGPGSVPVRALTRVPRRARRRRAAARMQRLRRELGGGRGAPERTLTWQAMEQLR